jgi:hypothetical protein
MAVQRVSSHYHHWLDHRRHYHRCRYDFYCYCHACRRRRRRHLRDGRRRRHRHHHHHHHHHRCVVNHVYHPMAMPNHLAMAAKNQQNPLSQRKNVTTQRSLFPIVVNPNLNLYKKSFLKNINQ